MKLVANDYEPEYIIKIIREWTELTQEDFAKSINKSRRAIQGYEAGTFRYSIETLLDIAKKHNLKITIEKK